MSDNTSWEPPAAPAPEAGTPAPFAPPTPAAPAAGYGPPQPTPGWTPPPKPGLIPLRPLTLGTLLGAAFQVLRRNPRPTFGFSLLVTGVIYIVTLLVVGFVTFFAFSRVATANLQDQDELAAGAFALVILSALVPAGLGIVGTAILQGVISLEVARGTLGEKLRLGGLWRAARGRIGALIGWSLLIAAVIVLGIAILAGIIAALVAFGGTAGIVIGVLLGLLVGAGVAVLFAWLSTKLCLVPSVLMLERLPLRAAIARSWSLTGGFFWKTFGIQLLVNAIVQTVAGIIGTPLQLVVGLGGSLIDPNGTDGGAVAIVIIVGVLSIVLTVVFGAISSVILSATAALIYIDIRMRKEGLDLELSRFVEARQAGDPTVQDPYLLKSAPAAPAPAPSASPWS